MGPPSLTRDFALHDTRAVSIHRGIWLASQCNPHITHFVPFLSHYLYPYCWFYLVKVTYMEFMCNLHFFLLHFFLLGKGYRVNTLLQPSWSGEIRWKVDSPDPAPPQVNPPGLPPSVFSSRETVVLWYRLILCRICVLILRSRVCVRLLPVVTWWSSEFRLYSRNWIVNTSESFSCVGSFVQVII